MIEILGVFLGIGAFPCLLLGVIMLISFLTCDYIEKFVVKAFCSLKNRRRHRFRDTNKLEQPPPPPYFKPSAPFETPTQPPSFNQEKVKKIPAVSPHLKGQFTEETMTKIQPTESIPPNPIDAMEQQSRVTHRKTQRLSSQNDPPPSYHSLKLPSTSPTSKVKSD